jgi:hypothetical protein
MVTLVGWRRRLDAGLRPSKIEAVAKLSVVLPDDLLRSIKRIARGDVSSFLAEAARNELDRRHLRALVQEMEDELGAVNEEQVARIGAMFARINAPRRSGEGEDS